LLNTGGDKSANIRFGIVVLAETILPNIVAETISPNKIHYG